MSLTRSSTQSPRCGPATWFILTPTGNVICDGARCRLVDFGLAMSADMELSNVERIFLSRHLHYDYGVMLGYLGLMLAVTLGEEPSSRMLRHHLVELGALEGRCPPALLCAIDRYRHPILYMVEFRANPPTGQAQHL